MKKTAVALLFCGASAFATTITFSTTATFSGPDADNAGTTLTSGGSTIKFAGMTGETVDAPSGIDIGAIDLTSTGSGDFQAGDMITLEFDQTSPSVGIATTESPLTGTVQTTSSGLVLDFTNQTLMIGEATYILDASYPLLAPNVDAGAGLGKTALFAEVTAPEPASVGLLGASMFGLGLLFRRRGQKQ
jgi:hypothetical protein